MDLAREMDSREAFGVGIQPTSDGGVASRETAACGPPVPAAEQTGGLGGFTDSAGVSPSVPRCHIFFLQLWDYRLISASFNFLDDDDDDRGVAFVTAPLTYFLLAVLCCWSVGCVTFCGARCRLFSSVFVLLFLQSLVSSVLSLIFQKL